MGDSCNMSLKWIHSSLSSSMACWKLAKKTTSMIFQAINLHFFGISQDLSRCSSILPWTSPWRVGSLMWCLKSWFYTTPMGLCRTHKKHYSPFGVVYWVSIVSLVPICCENMWKPHPLWIWGSALTACEARKQWPHVMALLQEAPSRESWNRSDGIKRLRRSVFVDSPRK